MHYLLHQHLILYLSDISRFLLPTINCVADNSCPKGWTRLGGRCFVFQNHRMEFADAEVWTTFTQSLCFCDK